MTKSLIGAMFVVSIGLSFARAQAPSESPFKIVRVSPALDAVVSANVKLEVLGEHFGLTEGPLWVQEGKDGYLLFSDRIANVIYKWTRNAPLSVFLENSGYTGMDPLNAAIQTRRGRAHVVMIGSNGLTLDPQGRLVIAATADRNVVRLEKDGTRTILADRYEGKRFNGPNDVIVRSNGTLYFTDSLSGLRGGADSPARELPFNGFYLVRDGKVTLLGSDKDPQGGAPNGITLSPDEEYLYVTAGRKIFRYEVQSDDTVRNRREFADVMGNDGMKVDQRGNLYSTSGAGPGEVRITSPEGTRLGLLQLPVLLAEPRPQVCATNVAFGDADSKGLYITACTHLFRVRVNIPGVRPRLAG
jgi:gluconolactonase